MGLCKNEPQYAPPCTIILVTRNPKQWPRWSETPAWHEVMGTACWVYSLGNPRYWDGAVVSVLDAQVAGCSLMDIVSSGKVVSCLNRIPDSHRKPYQTLKKHWNPTHAPSYERLGRASSALRHDSRWQVYRYVSDGRDGNFRNDGNGCGNSGCVGGISSSTCSKCGAATSTATTATTTILLQKLSYNCYCDGRLLPG